MLYDLILCLLGIYGDIFIILNNKEIIINNNFNNLNENERNLLNKLLQISFYYNYLNNKKNKKKIKKEKELNNIKLYYNSFYIGINDILEVEITFFYSLFILILIILILLYLNIFRNIFLIFHFLKIK